MVFQNYAVFPHMTVFENVAFGLKSRGVKTSEIKVRVVKALEMARLSGYEKRTPGSIERRAATARGTGPGDGYRAAGAADG